MQNLHIQPTTWAKALQLLLNRSALLRMSQTFNRQAQLFTTDSSCITSSLTRAPLRIPTRFSHLNLWPSSPSRRRLLNRKSLWLPNLRCPQKKFPNWSEEIAYLISILSTSKMNIRETTIGPVPRLLCSPKDSILTVPRSISGHGIDARKILPLQVSELTLLHLRWWI